MTDSIDLDTLAPAADVTKQPLTRNQRRFVTAFAVIGTLVLVAYLALSLQLGNEINNLSDALAHGLMSSK